MIRSNSLMHNIINNINYNVILLTELQKYE